MLFKGEPMRRPKRYEIMHKPDYKYAMQLADAIRNNPRYSSHRPINMLQIIKDLGFTPQYSKNNDGPLVVFNRDEMVVYINNTYTSTTQLLGRVGNALYKYLLQYPEEGIKLGL